MSEQDPLNLKVEQKKESYTKKIETGPDYDGGSTEEQAAKIEKAYEQKDIVTDSEEVAEAKENVEEKYEKSTEEIEQGFTLEDALNYDFPEIRKNLKEKIMYANSEKVIKKAMKKFEGEKGETFKNGFVKWMNEDPIKGLKYARAINFDDMVSWSEEEDDFISGGGSYSK